MLTEGSALPSVAVLCPTELKSVIFGSWTIAEPQTMLANVDCQWTESVSSRFRGGITLPRSLLTLPFFEEGDDRIAQIHLARHGTHHITRSAVQGWLFFNASSGFSLSFGKRSKKASCRAHFSRRTSRSPELSHGSLWCSE